MYLLLHDVSLFWKLELEIAVTLFQDSGVEPFEMTKGISLLSDNILGRLRKENLISKTPLAPLSVKPARLIEGSSR